MPIKHTTLCFLIKDGQILLAMKKRGHGQSKWNGVGGKLEKGELPVDAAVREAQEEIEVTPLKLEKVAEIQFLYPAQPEETRFDQICHVFFCKSWKGEPAETEEMQPKWFPANELPFEQMWSDDPIWLPEVLAGKNVKASFTFDIDNKITSHEIQTTPL